MDRIQTEGLGIGLEMGEPGKQWQRFRGGHKPRMHAGRRNEIGLAGHSDVPRRSVYKEPGVPARRRPLLLAIEKTPESTTHVLKQENVT